MLDFLKMDQKAKLRHRKQADVEVLHPGPAREEAFREFRSSRLPGLGNPMSRDLGLSRSWVGQAGEVAGSCFHASSTHPARLIETSLGAVSTTLWGEGRHARIHS